MTRRVLVTAIETGLDDDLAVVSAPQSEAPGGPGATSVPEPTPALECNDGSRVVGTEAICAFLDSRHERPKMMPSEGEARLEIEQLQGAADDLLGAALARHRELIRPEELRWKDEAEAQRRRVNQLLDRLEPITETVLVGPVTLGHIALACTLAWIDEHLSFDDWRSGYPSLAEWYDRFAGRPSMQMTASPPR